MATSPVLINSLLGLFGRAHGARFTEAQIQTLLLTNAVSNASTCRGDARRPFAFRG